MVEDMIGRITNGEEMVRYALEKLREVQEHHETDLRVEYSPRILTIQFQ